MITMRAPATGSFAIIEDKTRPVEQGRAPPETDRQASLRQDDSDETPRVHVPTGRKPLFRR